MVSDGLKVIKFSKSSFALDNVDSSGENDFTKYLVGILETANQELIDEIENDLVDIGSLIVGNLVKALDSQNPKLRKLAAMALIRIGDDVIVPLMEEYEQQPQKQWMVDFLVAQIACSEPDIVSDSCIKSTMAS